MSVKQVPGAGESKLRVAGSKAALGGGPPPCGISILLDSASLAAPPQHSQFGDLLSAT